jgi:hypothetical protein
MLSRRRVVDYGLQRRATLSALFSGLTTATEVCDADPYLLRAAKFHGEATSRTCPVCRRHPLTHLTYTFGEQLGEYSGRIKATAQLESMSQEYGEFTVYVVEVCQECGWNHIALSYVLGDGQDRRPQRSRRSRPVAQ